MRFNISHYATDPMHSIFLFDGDRNYAGEVASEEPISSNPVIREYADARLPFVLVSYPEDGQWAGTVSQHTEVRPGDRDFFWAALAEFRRKGNIPFVFDEERRGIARLILSLPLNDSERIEFFSRLVYVPRDQLKDLSQGILESLEGGKPKTKLSGKNA